MIILRCKDIKKYFAIERGYLKEKAGAVKALDGVSLEVERGSTFGLVGESGSGKTTLGKIALGILRPDSGTLEVGSGRLQVIFQDPYNSLDPKMRTRDILAEGLILMKNRDRRPYFSKKRIADALDLVGLPANALDKYPHQFSGGERQRIAIARVVLTSPELIVCDEPVSSLDVTIQLQILKLLKTIQREFAITYLFISHDLRVVRFMSDRIAVMKEGKIVEEGEAEAVYKTPSHPYTKLLLSSVLDLYPRASQT